MLKEYPLISIITLNYNTAGVTCAFLESTRRLTYPNYEIIVCDMASVEDPTEKIVAGDYPNIHLLLSDQNLGFAAGNNLGMRHAKGDYFLIINNDTEVTPDLLERLLEPFLINPAIGAVCPKIRYFDAPELIQYAGFRPMNPFTGRTSSIGDKEVDRGQYDVPGYTSGAHGCAMLVSRQVTDKVGMFPEKFFLYYEEWDWSARMIRAGLSIYYQPTALVFHKESLSVGRQSPLKVYYQTRNRILYMRRNSNFLQLSVFLLFFTVFTIPKSVLVYLKNRQFEHLRSFLNGTLWNLTSKKYSAV